MAYLRFSPQCDVYVLDADDAGDLVCLRCPLTDEYGEFHARTTAQMVDHLNAHRAAGQKVPEEGLKLLDNEKDTDAWILARHPESGQPDS